MSLHMAVASWAFASSPETHSGVWVWNAFKLWVFSNMDEDQAFKAANEM
jgi:hypothetical protein